MMELINWIAMLCGLAFVTTLEVMWILAWVLK